MMLAIIILASLALLTVCAFAWPAEAVAPEEPPGMKDTENLPE